jgi:regulator of sigma E protease
MFSLLYILSAALGLGFLIFIHELGHYIVARRSGIRVEVFSIGFGRPIKVWQINGVKWQVCWLPFGGYVRMAGMENENGVEATEIPDGFWGKSPWDRMKVALAGPIVNLVFALLVFALIWSAGGREKPFAQYTQYVGWVDPKSELYKQGVRPGDVVQSYDGHPVQDQKDHLYAAMFGDHQILVKGVHYDALSGEAQSFEQQIKSYQHPAALEEGILTTGILSPASYLIYERFPGDTENPLPEGSPMENSGLRYGDRVAWVDGVMVHSLQHLGAVLNAERALLTVQRGEEILLARVPRVAAGDLRLEGEVSEELSDWQFAAGLGDAKLNQLYTLPYNLTADAVVENRIAFIDADLESKHFPFRDLSPLDAPLVAGDRILAVDGTPVSFSHQLFGLLQAHKVHVIVERDGAFKDALDWSKADTAYAGHLDYAAIQKIAASIGSGALLQSQGRFHLLKPVEPVTREVFVTAGKTDKELRLIEKQREQAIASIEDPVKRAEVLELWKKQEKQLLLGIPGVQDRMLVFNPAPHQQFNQVFQETWRTLEALVTGYLSPKWVSGPVGIVQVIHHGWSIGVVEVLFWLGVISLNLGVLNLMPIPVLDGGYIVLSLLEIVSGKRFKPKHVEKVIIPFAILLLTLFVFLTFNDLSRVFAGWW